MATNYNNFKSTTVRGEFRNSNYPDNSVLAVAYFDGSMNILGSLIDASGNIIPNNKLRLLQNDLVTLAQVRSANNTFTGINDFSGNSVSCNVAPTTANHLCNKTYVDTKTTLAGVVSANNVWTGTNAFNTNLPTSTITPTTNDQLCRKGYVDTQVATKATVADITGGSLAYTGTNTYNTNLPTSTINPTTDNQLCRKGYVDTQVATKASIAQVEASALNLAGAVIFTNVVPPACAIAPSGANSLTNKTYVDGQIATRPTTADILTGTNTFTNNNTFQSVLFCDTIRAENIGDAVSLYTTTTTGSVAFFTNASFSGNFNLCQNQSGIFNLGTLHTGTINIATGVSATATVNIGRSNGSNAVNIGAWTFNGNNLEFPNFFTTPSVNQLGYSISSLGTANQNLTTDTWLNIETINLGLGVWIITGSMNMSKQAAGATGTTISEILFGLSETAGTVDTINYYSAQYDAMPVAHQRAFAANNTRKFILTATTTIYLNIKCIFTIGTGLNMRVNDCQIEAVRVG